MPRRQAVLATALALVSGLVGLASVSAATLPTNVNVSKRGGNQSEAAVAVDPTNTDHVVVVSNLALGSGLFLGVSRDAGSTWHRSVIATGSGPLGLACCDPTLTWDVFGNLFLAWLDADDLGALPIALSTDGGSTWDLLRVLHPAPLKTATAGVQLRDVPRVDERDHPRGAFVDQPTIVSGSSSVWVVWNNHGSMQASGARVFGLGDVGFFRHWQDVPHTAGCTFGDAAVGAEAQLMQVCQKDVAGTDPPVSKLKVSVDPDGVGPLGFDEGSLVGMTHVSLFEPIKPQKRRTVDAEAGLGYDTLASSPFFGRVYLMFTDEEPDQTDNTDVWLMSSDDDGASWTDPVRVNDIVVRSQFLPRISVDPTTGVLAIGWHDARNDVGDGGFGDTDGRRNTDAMYYLTFSSDGGGSFGPALRVSHGASNAEAANNTIDFGDYTGLAFVGGAAHPAWADNSNSTGDNPGGRLGQFDVYSAFVGCC